MSRLNFAGKHSRTNYRRFANCAIYNVLQAFLLTTPMLGTPVIAETVQAPDADPQLFSLAYDSRQYASFTTTGVDAYPEILPANPVMTSKTNHSIIDFSLVSNDYSAATFIEQGSTRLAINPKQANNRNATVGNSATDFINLPPGQLLVDDDYDLHSKSGGAALGSLFRAGLKTWWSNEPSGKLGRISESVPDAAKGQGLASTEDTDWNYSIKLSDDDIKLRLKREF